MGELRRRNVCRSHDREGIELISKTLDKGSVDYVMVLGNALVRYDHTLIARTLIAKLLMENAGLKKIIKIL